MRKMEFSKKLAISVSFLFFFTIIFSLGAWLVLNRVPSEILTAVAAPFGVVISGYFVKAGVENYKKIEGECNNE